MANVKLNVSTLESALKNHPGDIPVVDEYLLEYVDALRDALESEGHTLTEVPQGEHSLCEIVEGESVDDEDDARLVMEQVGDFWRWYN